MKKQMMWSGMLLLTVVAAQAQNKKHKNDTREKPVLKNESIQIASGMGSVGTGGSTGAVGSSGPAMGVNGKNPYASPGAYGTRIPFTWRPATDSVENRNTKTRY